MKRIPIFKPGRHTASSGATLDFSEAQVRAAVAAYDPALHEAPIVIGHPKDNGPAWGWIKSLDFDEATGEIVAIPDQVAPEFAELVEAGRFKKRSASWYLPDAPNNPKPGSLYLRHVGFLGAQPPAVKGLGAISFSDAEEGVAEFVDSARYAWGSVNAILRGIREWIIGKDGLETADKIVPNFFLSDLEAAAKEATAAPVQVDNPAGMSPAFSEGNPHMKTLPEALARITALEAENATLKANQRPADFAEREAVLQTREAALAAGEAKIARAGIESRVDKLIADGKVLPAQKKHTVDFALSLADAEATIDFGEGDSAKKVSQREAYMLQLEAGHKIVDYREHSAPAAGGGGEPPLAALQQQVFDQVATGKAAASK
jgi:hypothetical protein